MEQEGLKKERAFNMAESFLLQLSVFSSLKDERCLVFKLQGKVYSSLDGLNENRKREKERKKEGMNDWKGLTCPPPCPLPPPLSVSISMIPRASQPCQRVHIPYRLNNWSGSLILVLLHSTLVLA